MERLSAIGGYVEGALDNPRFDRLVADQNINLAANGGKFNRDIRHAQVTIQRGGEHTAGHMANLLTIFEDGVMLTGDAAFDHLEAHQDL